MTMEQYIEHSIQKYDPCVVAIFKHDHDKLLAQYDALLDSRYRESSSHKELFEELNDLCTNLMNHFHQEDEQIYTHLASTMSKRQKATQVVHYLQQKMYEIEGEIENILETNNPDKAEWCWELMPDTLERLGDILRKRIDTEEALLFPMYQASGPIEIEDKDNFGVWPKKFIKTISANKKG